MRPPPGQLQCSIERRRSVVALTPRIRPPAAVCHRRGGAWQAGAEVGVCFGIIRVRWRPADPAPLKRTRQTGLPLFSDSRKLGRPAGHFALHVNPFFSAQVRRGLHRPMAIDCAIRARPKSAPTCTCKGDCECPGRAIAHCPENIKKARNASRRCATESNTEEAWHTQARRGRAVIF